MTEKELRIKWHNILLKLGITPNARGYHYLVEIMLVLEEDRTRIHSIHKEIYPVVEEKFNTTQTRIERAIRYIIEQSVKKIRKSEEWKHTFSYYPLAHFKVSEFISIIFTTEELGIIKEMVRKGKIQKQQQEVA